MAKIAVIGGTGLYALEGLEIERRESIRTPYGEPSAPLVHGQLAGVELLFLARHGEEHHIPPHQVNYRANIYALQQAGASQIIAVAAVGGIRQGLMPGHLIIPDQLIDYTWGRAHTFFEEGPRPVVHTDFTEPYCEALRKMLLRAAEMAELAIVAQGTYGATQGPRLESRAEIDRLERDGCDIVGMTAMPEAALARELDICYATCAIVANPAAGRAGGPLLMDEIAATLKLGMKSVCRLLEVVVPIL
ncbi:MAG: S-methyl-5'-thioinosine phosphorylase [Gammaproteobacteria bacterium]|jgi:5'-deoxy-5'-methylthioadenosine phosphorylase